MGGYLAALYASRHPETAKLVLLAPAFGFSSRWTALTGPEKLATWKDTNTLEVYHYGEQRTRNLSYSLFEDALNYAVFPDVSQPTLIFHGMHDDVVPIELSREFAANRPKVTLLELDSDHELLSCLDEIVSESVPFLCSGAIPERV
jgi:pimeloyl-ACP methyl ester carboxylesterase